MRDAYVPERPTPSRCVGLDVTVAVWVVFWIVVGVLAAVEIATWARWAIRWCAPPTACSKTADTLSGLRSIPLIGGSLGDAVKQVDATAAAATPRSPPPRRRSTTSA